MPYDKANLRIGELLIQAGILTGGELQDVMETARTAGLPVGRVLVMAGFLTESAFQSTVLVQSLLRDSIVPLDVAVKALTLVCENDLALDEALVRLDWKRDIDKESNKLGELLLEAEVVSADTLQTAMHTGLNTGLPLGAFLVSTGIISDEILSTALIAQVLIRNGSLTRDEGIRGLKAAYGRRQPIELILRGQGFYRGPLRASIRLGELLVLAHVLTEKQVLAFLKESLKKEQSLGRVLVESEVISLGFLVAVLTVQEMVANETLQRRNAVEVLYTLNHGTITLPQVLAHLVVPEEEFRTRVHFHELLRIAGVIRQEDVSDSITEKPTQPSSSYAAHMGNILLQEGYIDRRMFCGALRCYYLLANGFLNMQQAMIALNYFHHRQCTFDDVMYELKWTVKTTILSPEEREAVQA